ncbi:MFS general substrate transporter [Marasmius fiardii PR-910]|nr:MFS general substrate transporter [Marasmius fiardii PR-910]
MLDRDRTSIFHTVAYRDHEHSPRNSVISVVQDDRTKSKSVFTSIMIVAACTLSNMVNTANMTGPSIALPSIERELRVNQVQLVWVVSAYSLSSGCMLLLIGRLADIYGRKKAFILGNLWLIAFTLGCGFVNDPITLSVLRGLQGCGASATIPAALGIMAGTFPPSKARSLAFATFAGGSPIGGAFGMALGGAMTQLTKSTWRSIFYFSAGLTFLSLVLGMIFIEKDSPSEEKDKRTDWIGGLLSTSGLVLVVFVLAQGEEAPNTWANPYIITLLIVGVLLTVAYVMWQRFLEKVTDKEKSSPYSWIPTPPPLMRPSLWTRSNGRVAVVMIIAFLGYASFMGWSFWILLYYQNFLGLTPILTMVRLIPMFITGIACNVLVAGVVGRVPLVVLLTAGCLITSSAALLFALINPNAVYWAFGFPSAILAVVGADFIFPSGTIFVAKVSLPHEQSVAGAVFQGMTQLGAAVGTAISTIAYNRVLEKQAQGLGIPADDVSQSLRLPSYHAAQWVNFGFGAFAALLSIVFMRGVGAVGAKPCFNQHKHHHHLPWWKRRHLHNAPPHLRGKDGGGSVESTDDIWSTKVESLGEKKATKSGGEKKSSEGDVSVEVRDVEERYGSN